MIRKPVVAGQFYSASEKLLKKEVERLVVSREDKINALGVVAPHAGYLYSGAVAGAILSSIEPKPTYLILGPNHTGYGKPFGIDLNRSWKTPLGEVQIDNQLGEALVSGSRFIQEDRLCHDYEHSIEVELPFLQVVAKGFKFVPIAVSSSDKGTYKKIGLEIRDAISSLKVNVTIIASSDMTHYEPHEVARAKDMKAVDKILALDIDGFLRTIEKDNISMCGFAPTAIMMSACVGLGAKRAKLVRYNTSADASGDHSSVVGYAGIAIY